MRQVSVRTQMLGLATLLFLIAGCAKESQKRASTEGQGNFQKAQPNEEQQKAEKENRDRAGDNLRQLGLAVQQAGLDRPKVKNELKMIGLGYFNMRDAYRRPPARLDELMPFLENSPELRKALSPGGRYTFIYNARVPADPGKTVLGYETNPGADGSRVVLMADASVQVMSEQEFKKAPRAEGTTDPGVRP